MLWQRHEIKHHHRHRSKINLYSASRTWTKAIKAQIPLDSSRHVSTRLDTCSTCRAHAFWLCRTCRTARLDALDTTRARHVERVVSRRDVTCQVEFGLNEVKACIAHWIETAIFSQVGFKVKRSQRHAVPPRRKGYVSA